MNKLIVLIILLSGPVFAQTTLQPFKGIVAELTAEYENAEQPAAIEDFADIDVGGQICAVYKKDWEIQKIGSFEWKWKDAGFRGMGPRFPDVQGETFIKKGLVYKDLSKEERAKAVSNSDAISFESKDLVWFIKEGQYRRFLHFRKSGAYIYFKMQIDGQTEVTYGYCWNEKNQ